MVAVLVHKKNDVVKIAGEDLSPILNVVKQIRKQVEKHLYPKSMHAFYKVNYAWSGNIDTGHGPWHSNSSLFVLLLLKEFRNYTVNTCKTCMSWMDEDFTVDIWLRHSLIKHECYLS